MTVFLLGPARDDSGQDAPLGVRQDLARRMESAGTRTLVMEDEADVENETNFEKFLRLIAGHEPGTFLILVPLGARLHGLSVELGHLMTRMSRGDLDPSRVHLALQHRLASIETPGVLALRESGNRTRYYEDLVDMGCPVHRWTDRAELNRHAVAVSIEDDALTLR